MKVSKWGNSLAIRLPAEYVTALGLKEGDDLSDKIDKIDLSLTLRRKHTREEAWAILRELAKTAQIPEDYKFDREEANSRGK